VRRWRLVERRDIVDPVDPASVYLTRWHVVDTPWFGVKVHHIHKADPGTALHDHPWSFLSIVLRGGYVEQLGHPDLASLRMRTVAVRNQRTVHFARAEHLHRISAVRPGTWTLVLCGRRRRRWGFEQTPGRWMDRAEWTTAGQDERGARATAPPPARTARAPFHDDDPVAARALN
jgi:hypothetical protein